MADLSSELAINRLNTEAKEAEKALKGDKVTSPEPETYITIPKPLVWVGVALLLLGIGILVGASLFPAHETTVKHVQQNSRVLHNLQFEVQHILEVVNRLIEN